jgi:hypothetical protein
MAISTLPEGPLGGLLLLYTVLSPLIVLGCASAFLLFRWIRKRISAGKPHGCDAIVDLARRHSLLGGKTDMEACLAQERFFAVIGIMFLVPLVGVLVIWANLWTA